MSISSIKLKTEDLAFPRFHLLSMCPDLNQKSSGFCT